MADRSLINFWLAEAADQNGDDETAQIEWLRAKRREYAPAVMAGDHEVTSSAGDGGSSSSRRGISDREHHDAILGALRSLGASDIGGGAVLQVQFSGILG